MTVRSCILAGLGNAPSEFVLKCVTSDDTVARLVIEGWRRWPSTSVFLSVGDTDRMKDFRVESLSEQVDPAIEPGK